MLGTLAKVAKMGYKAVELAGYGNSNAVEVRAALDEYGLKAASIHAGLALFEGQLSQLLKDIHTLGCNYVVVPFLPNERRTRAEVERLPALLNQWGKLGQTEGFQLGYHNHAFEFEAFSETDTTTIWDIITQQTDTELVKLELDVFWASYAGKDPIAVIKSQPNRIQLLHIKDMAGDGSRADLPVGDGIIAWEPILEISRQNNAQWYIVEQDHPQDALNNVEHSLQNLRQLLKTSQAQLTA
jgi:sugar phosphate isomerase/epimerase